MMLDGKKILDVTCGSRTIWFDKNHPAAIYCDKRDEEYTAVWTSTVHDSRRKCIVHPDVIADFTNLPFYDNSFSLVVFDPPHLTSVGESSWTYKKYGKLEDGWQDMLRDGFQECMRVLKPDGVLIFKWSETQIPAGEVWQAIGQKPLFGHHSGKKMNTFWACFMKIIQEGELSAEDQFGMRAEEGMALKLAEAEEKTDAEREKSRELAAKVKELQERPVEVAIQPDTESINRAAELLRTAENPEIRDKLKGAMRKLAQMIEEAAE